LLAFALYAFIHPTENQLLDLTTNTLFFLGLSLIGALVSYFLSKRNIITWGQMIFAPSHLTHNSEELAWYQTLWGWQAAVTLVVLFAAGLLSTKFSIMDLLDEDGFNGAVRLFKGLASPNFSILPKAVVNVFETIFMAFIATALAIPFAFVLSFLTAKNVMQGPVSFSIYWLLRLVLNVVRSIEALIWAIIFSVWVGIGPFAGMLALMIHSIASLAKQYSEMVETVDEGPIEGVLSTGAGKLQMIWFSIVPQVVLPFISFTVYRWDINVRMATIIGLVGGGGIGTMLIQYQGQAMWGEVGCIILVIAVVVWLMDQASTYIREALK